MGFVYSLSQAGPAQWQCAVAAPTERMMACSLSGKIKWDQSFQTATLRTLVCLSLFLLV